MVINGKLAHVNYTLFGSRLEGNLFSFVSLRKLVLISQQDKIINTIYRDSCHIAAPNMLPYFTDKK